MPFQTSASQEVLNGKDFWRLRQVLANLLGNALKFTERGRIVLTIDTIEATSDGARLAFAVQDTGIGIPEADLSRIFERFYRVDKARSRDLGGTGLGLAIVKHMAQAMNGEVFIKSIEGSGTSVSLVLPAA